MPTLLHPCLSREMAVERVSLDRKSSIEEEPLTLYVDQLRFAREAALYVTETMSMEDALRIFTEGLEPMACARHNKDVKGLCVNLIDSEEEDGGVVFPVPRDIASAPF